MQNDGITKLNFFKKLKAGSVSGFNPEYDNRNLDPTLTIGPGNKYIQILITTDFKVLQHTNVGR